MVMMNGHSHRCLVNGSFPKRGQQVDKANQGWGMRSTEVRTTLAPTMPEHEQLRLY